MPVNPVTIEKLIYGGDGLSRNDGEVVFTPFVLPGETVDIERTGARGHAQRSRLVSVVAPSASRVTPPCPYFTRCGGCHYQHADYPSQLEIKRGILAETLRRVGKIDFPEDRIAIESAEPYGYRNRVQFHFENGRMGYRAMRSRSLIAIEECPISSPKINEIIVTLNRLMRSRSWPRFLTSLEVFTDETSVQWNALEATQPLARKFFEWLAAEVPGTVSGPLEYSINGDLFRVGGSSFFQVNRFLAPRLAELAIGDAGGSVAWDLYAGVGLFSLTLARRFRRVTSVESGHSAVDDLEFNAARARVGVEAINQSVDAFLLETNDSPDFILADPPRAGLDKIATARLLELETPAITLVACDPATLARDLAVLSTRYEIASLTMADLFPQTFHIEAIAKLVRK